MAIGIKYNCKDIRVKEANKVKAWLSDLIRHEKRKEGRISFLFVSDKELLKINRDFLDHDTLTDIITFDYSEKKTIIGEILISSERVVENAASNTVSVQEEVRRVMAHGVLHLCGYKDKSKKEVAEMRQKEGYYLKRFTAA